MSGGFRPGAIDQNGKLFDRADARPATPTDLRRLDSEAKPRPACKQRF
jgi:hypothetical protein